jgi:hypothetical protein
MIVPSKPVAKEDPMPTITELSLEQIDSLLGLDDVSDPEAD